MYKWKKELQELIKKDSQYKDNIGGAIKRQLDSFSGKRCFGDVVMPAFREIEKVFQSVGSPVWIHCESNRAWLSIGYESEESGKKEYTKEVKYEISILGRTMKSRLYLLWNGGPQKECPINDEHEIAGEATGKSIADTASEDIIEDFMAVYGEYVNKAGHDLNPVQASEIKGTVHSYSF